MMVLPDVEPTSEKKTADKNILAEMLGPKQPEAITGYTEHVTGCNCADNLPRPAAAKKRGMLARLNELIKALEAVDEIDMCDEVLRSQLKEKMTELIGMRSIMYGHLVDWDELARSEEA